MRLFLPALSLSLLAFIASCGGGGGGGSDVAQFFRSAVYQATQVSTHTDVAFSHRPNAGHKQYTSDARKAAEADDDQLTLMMDIWVPPNATSMTPMPLVIFVHGGGFNSGGKEDRAADAMSYASAGFVTASVNYRLTPNNTDDGATRTLAIEQAADDVMNAVRFLKSKSSTYHIDASRIAIVGTSAGGALALVTAIQAEPDTLENTLSDYPNETAKVAAVVSTGATLIDPLFDSDPLLHYDSGDSPVLMMHAKPDDPQTHATWDGNVLPTQQRINSAGGSCTAVSTGGNHTVLMTLGSNYWDAAIEPFLWKTLRLSALSGG
jgi:acetyl esterase/lipase